jgi:hypothetical protein
VSAVLIRGAPVSRFLKSYYGCHQRNENSSIPHALSSVLTPTREATGVRPVAAERALLNLFLVEKAAYEISYERPVRFGISPACFEEEALPQYIAKRRWFGLKDQTIQSARIANVADLCGAEREIVFCEIEVRTAYRHANRMP